MRWCGSGRVIPNAVLNVRDWMRLSKAPDYMSIAMLSGCVSQSGNGLSWLDRWLRYAIPEEMGRICLLCLAPGDAILCSKPCLTGKSSFPVRPFSILPCGSRLEDWAKVANGR